MSEPVHLSFPENTHVSIYVGSPAMAPAATGSETESSGSRHIVRNTVAAALLIGVGYGAHGVLTSAAVADPGFSPSSLPVMSLPPDLPATPSVSPRATLPPNIHLVPPQQTPTPGSAQPPSSISHPVAPTPPPPQAVAKNPFGLN